METAKYTRTLSVDIKCGAAFGYLQLQVATKAAYKLHCCILACFQKVDDCNCLHIELQCPYGNVCAVAALLQGSLTAKLAAKGTAVQQYSTRIKRHQCTVHPLHTIHAAAVTHRCRVLWGGCKELWHCTWPVHWPL
eukprot:GHRR01003063.1.p1 GENE.GHRR01003063.1~~GHRR01003063.1.p1  ORF type:complete len:136 (+),score=28.14 GHRR01003063.1:1029-1436(+)